MESEVRTANRLIQEQSPYLQQHAHNPVDWYPWGQEALDRARRENRPILLSCGYSSCHWCHVMEKESFENQEIADLMNRSFINIKVDREERPDLDEIYQTACGLLTGQGGWPLTVFLTPDLEPFYAGTYFPPQDKYGRPGFDSVLRTIDRVYREEQPRVRQIAGEITAAMRGELVPSSEQLSIGEMDPSELDGLPYEAVQRLKRHYDSRYGGFGGAPKFPTTNLLQLFLQVGLDEDAAAVDMVISTLEKMAQGGIFDHLGGGFHRYSTDKEWLVPHFEKMLYDNALLVPVYLAGYQLSGKESLRRAVDETLHFVLREMTAPEGGFYATLDADTEGEEGRFYVWRHDVVIDLLGEKDGGIICEHLGITPSGNFEKGTSVLRLQADAEAIAGKHGLEQTEVDEILRRGKAEMLAEREKRTRPFRDEKVITAWNGMMISALAQAARVLEEPEYAQAAEAAARFVSDQLTDAEGRLLRSYKDQPANTLGYLSDYGFFINGLIDLFEATLDHKYLSQALALTKDMVARFWDDADSGFFDTSQQHAKTLMRTKRAVDQSTPSGTSQAVLALIRLAELDDGFSRIIERVFALFADEMAHNSWGCAALISALDWWQAGSTEVMVVGDPMQAGFRDLYGAASRQFVPRLVLVGLTSGWETAWDTPPALWLTRQEMAGNSDEAVAFVCRHRACSAPITQMGQLQSQFVPAYKP